MEFRDFILSAYSYKDYPATKLPEVAFAGRSNVGKSSLINYLLGRKSVAKISKTPGKTRSINFYSYNHILNLVDLPGYGYAKRSQKEIKQYQFMVEEYLRLRENLKAVMVLVDARRSIRSEDLDLFDWLDSYKIGKSIILTKSDKISKNVIKPLKAEISKSLSKYQITEEDLIISSVLKKVGKKEINATMRSHLLK